MLFLLFRKASYRCFSQLAFCEYVHRGKRLQRRGPASPLMHPTTWPGTPLAVGARSNPSQLFPQPTPVLPRSGLKAHVPAPRLDPCQAPCLRRRAAALTTRGPLCAAHFSSEDSDRSPGWGAGASRVREFFYIFAYLAAWRFCMLALCAL